ncbi:hypothetical protein [Mesobacillus jeotgali]|uniref:hypothetical protein n=1 Tax=Mesobacillus jeotgali TaxID=129985 RepID=UPI00177DECEE|nr:hypothetical protein [Mesobacillus jeotgali]UYZ21806.1 hypothetical protein FOF60_22920 [Mesobacillus jeotgali]
MKKSLKFAIIPVLILLAGTAGALYYFLNVKEYDVADEKVDEITKTEYKVALPDLGSLGDGIDGGSDENRDDTGSEGSEAALADTVSNNKAAVADTGSRTEAGTGSPSNIEREASVTKGKNIDGDTTKNEKTEGKKRKTDGAKKQDVTAEMIKAAYRPSFEALEAQANAKIDSLISTAYSEYNTKKQNGESISITYFYRKYISAGKELEASTDETFNYLYESLLKDLKAKGFSASEAAEFTTQYENAKAARETALIEKARSVM